MSVLVSEPSSIERRRELLLLPLFAIGSLALDNLAKEERELFFAFMLETLFFPSLTEEAAEGKESVVFLLFAGRLPLFRTARQRRRERDPFAPCS
jgi:O-antigen ligase